MRAQAKLVPFGVSVGFPAGLLLPSFAATLFLSAGLLFVVQPMIAKMVLPRLGGSPSVWNTSMCFFQAVLLVGYAYAHLLANRAGLRTQALVHGCVLFVAAAFLPLDLGAATPPAIASPVLWLVTQLAISVGPPFFAVSATAPLLQRWFSRSDHPSAADPYFLYAASNAGSLTALLAYPLLIEPNLPLPLQSRLWAAGLALMAAGIAVCWLGCRLRPGVISAAAAINVARASTAERLRWVGYAFVPSALLLAVTAHITTDLAAAPLFWVVPLALYLSTFILTFASRPPLPQPLMVKVQLFLLIPLIVISATVQSLWLIALHLALFFVTAMVCHGELARRRPPASDLTEFYLYVSLGGVLGGIFAALVAPVVFADIWEYPLLLVAACLVRPTSAERRGGLRIDVACILVLVACLGTLVYTGTVAGHLAAPVLMVAGLMLFRLSDRRWWLAGGVAAFLLVEYAVAAGAVLETSRSFFGVHRVKLVENGAIRALEDGTTIHGATYAAAGRETVPLGYYNREGPFGRFFAAIADRHPKNVGIVGLGTGALACYAQLGQSWTFHEIDPLVEKIARDPRYFHFLERCAAGAARVVLGDARLTLHDVPDGHYDILVIDAFSSDSIPLHLLTREALALYQRKVAPNGVIVFHISNRYVELKPVLTALAADAGSPVRRLLDLGPKTVTAVRLSTEIVTMGQPGRPLDDLPEADGWRDLAATPRAPLWTDERSDIIGSIRVFGRELRPD